MTAIDVALVGHGYAGRAIHAPLIRSVEGLRLACVVSSRPEAVHADLPDAAVAPDLEAALADHPDVRLVVVATPNQTHETIARQALEACRHVVVDKPVTVHAAAARGLADLAEARGLVASAFHNRRWDGDFQAIRRMLAEGTLGDLALFESRIERFRPKPRDRWRERPGAGTGLWYDLGPHLVDQALVLFGRPEAVTADLAAQREPGGAVDWFHVLLSYGRLRVILRGTSLAADPGARFTLYGSGGAWVKHGMDQQEAQLQAGIAPGGKGWREGTEPATLTRPAADGSLETTPVPVSTGEWRPYYEGVRDAILGRAPDPVPMREAVDVMRVMDAVLDSAESGTTVRPYRAGSGLK